MRVRFQSAALLQPRILRFGLLEDGDIGIGVFPEGEKILVGGFGFGGVALQGVGAGEAEMRQGTMLVVKNDARVSKDILKIRGGIFAETQAELCESAQVHCIH